MNVVEAVVEASALVAQKLNAQLIKVNQFRLIDLNSAALRLVGRPDREGNSDDR